MAVAAGLGGLGGVANATSAIPRDAAALLGPLHHIGLVIAPNFDDS